MNRRTLRTQRPKGGFSLIEILAALAIFGVAIVGMMRGIAETTAIQTDLQARQIGAMLAANIMEEISYSHSLEEGVEDGAFEGAYAAFHWRSEITPTEWEDLYAIHVTVEWDVGRGPMEQELQTLLLDEED